MKIPESELYKLRILTKEDNAFWIVLGRETCNLSGWYHNCHDVVVDRFGKGSDYAECFDVGFFMGNIRELLEVEIAKAYKPGSPEERAFVGDVNKTSVREIHDVSQVFYFTGTIEKPIDDNLEYVREFEKRAIVYFDFIRENFGMPVTWYYEWYENNQNKNRIL